MKQFAKAFRRLSTAGSSESQRQSQQPVPGPSPEAREFATGNDEEGDNRYGLDEWVAGDNPTVE